MKFSQLDITEKDDSKEKENLDKDEVLDNTSLLDMDNKKLETKINLEDKGEELDEESTRDSTPLLENESNQVNIKEDKPVEIDHGTEARRRKKGKGLRAFQDRRMKEGTEKKCYPRERRDGNFFNRPRTRCLSRARNFLSYYFSCGKKIVRGLTGGSKGRS